MIECRLCQKKFLNIPPDAVRIARRVWRMPDGSVHDFYQPKHYTLTKEAATARAVLITHTRFHKEPKPDCIHCNKEKHESPATS